MVNNQENQTNTEFWKEIFQQANVNPLGRQFPVQKTETKFKAPSRIPWRLIGSTLIITFVFWGTAATCLSRSPASKILGVFSHQIIFYLFEYLGIIAHWLFGMTIIKNWALYHKYNDFPEHHHIFLGTSLVFLLLILIPYLIVIILSRIDGFFRPLEKFRNYLWKLTKFWGKVFLFSFFVWLFWTMILYASEPEILVDRNARTYP